MSRTIKYRQPIFHNGKFEGWHYWGHTHDAFIGPMNADLQRLSQQYIELEDKNGKEIYKGDKVKVHGIGADDQFTDEVDFKWGMFNFKDKSYGVGCYKAYMLEVIGNNYETKGDK